jgi:hypothetical protein
VSVDCADAGSECGVLAVVDPELPCCCAMDAIGLMLNISSAATNEKNRDFMVETPCNQRDYIPANWQSERILHLDAARLAGLLFI